MDLTSNLRTLVICHGRLDPTTGGTNLAGELVDDWGFDGPRLEGIIGISYTYDTFSLSFVNEAAKDRALAQTSWSEGVHEHTLEMEFEEECLKLWNAERRRFEYFGDWSLGDWSLQK